MSRTTRMQGGNKGRYGTYSYGYYSKKDVLEWFKEYYGCTPKEYFKRDGNTGYDGRKKIFKRLCKKETRRENKRLCNKVIKGEDHENMVYPSVWETKHHIWDVF